MVRFWGRMHWISPRLVREVFGDGRTLLEIQPLNTRPDFYVIRVDSSVGKRELFDCTVDGTEDGEDLAEAILCAIEDEYGHRDECDCRCKACDDQRCEDCRNQKRHDRGQPWPALNADSGYSWGTRWWPDAYRSTGLEVRPRFRHARDQRGRRTDL